MTSPASPSVWAPGARTVALVIPTAAVFSASDAWVPMVPDASRPGWWSPPQPADLADDAGRYGFSVDGGPPRPDPRSARQPDGVHGPSQLVDTGAYVWTDHAWAGRAVPGAVLYELHVGTFTSAGTLDAAIERLGHLRDLGVDMVELMPVAAFDGHHGWGYDGVHPFAVHEPYGGPDALARFVDAAHALGLAVALDVVYNHLGPSGSYVQTFGPYFTDDHPTPWGQGINVDGAGSGEVRRWVIDNAVRWLRDFHVDALRLDAVHEIVDDSPVHVLAELSETVAALAVELGRPLGLIAESDANDPATVTPVAAGGLGMTAQWADDVHHAVHALLTGERQGYYADFGSPAVLARALTDVFVHDGGWSTFRGRPWGRPVPDEMDGHRFVVFSCDHDQVGNRALGDRPGSREGGRDLDLVAISAALVLTSACTPMLFMGEEWGASTPWLYFTDFPDPDLARTVTRGRREEFAGHGWDTGTVPDPQDRGTFERSVLNWSEPQDPRRAALVSWHRRLIELRRTVPDLASGDRSAVHVEALPAPGEGLLLVGRGSVTVAVNLSPTPRHMALTSGGRSGVGVLAAWGQVKLAGSTLIVPGRGVAVVG
ncbi:maltooligosyl trehalose hydrolase [Sanguibacter gelidistatuariae]|uniref:Malto-oligosyltrehalose trehalohydrolase n=1 Tax=Sanguibacter gelidistatuariae TaxID=1814289 RepID=A0A1G6RPG6_9MICO|nr:malto-oligosyltrehalose trehalohydrolase [Sanguibacter gelidistatuariae]SDD05837.1 maltooligosyl trehalose hydrolase [Sanguibacter gelidistatuariae]